MCVWNSRWWLMVYVCLSVSLNFPDTSKRVWLNSWSPKVKVNYPLNKTCMVYLRLLKLPFHVGFPDACRDVAFLHHLTQVEEAVDALILNTQTQTQTHEAQEYIPIHKCDEVIACNRLFTFHIYSCTSWLASIYIRSNRGLGNTGSVHYSCLMDVWCVWWVWTGPKEGGSTWPWSEYTDQNNKKQGVT